MTNKREPLIGRGYFIDRKGFLVLPAKLAESKVPRKAGEAYAFFHCNAPMQRVQEELPRILDSAQTPNRLEVSLKEGIEPHDFDLEGGKPSELGHIANDAKEQGLNYCMKVRDYATEQPADRESANRGAALKVQDILLHTSQSSLYPKGEPFRGKIFYERVPGDYPGDYAEI